MPSNKHKRLSQDTIKADREALLALKELTDYVPPNLELSIDAVCALEQLLREKESKAILSAMGHTADRDARYEAECGLHDTMQRIKAIVRGQYGSDSNEVQAMGLKKQGDYRRPSRRQTPTST